MYEWNLLRDIVEELTLRSFDVVILQINIDHTGHLLLLVLVDTFNNKIITIIIVLWQILISHTPIRLNTPRKNSICESHKNDNKWVQGKGKSSSKGANHLKTLKQSTIDHQNVHFYFWQSYWERKGIWGRKPQPKWRCTCSWQQYEDNCENKYLKKIPQMQTMWLCICIYKRFEKTFADSFWRKTLQM